jgi:ceramide glucosyltransferase
VAVLLFTLALLSLALALWQCLAAWRFPLHRRSPDKSFAPALTLLKPLKGRDAETPHCLRSWFTQNHAGPTQILFGVADPLDPVCDDVRALLSEFPQADAHLVLCRESLGANAKVSTLIQLQRQAKHDLLIVSDADVRVPVDFLANVVAPLREKAVGLVNCFYRLANPTTTAMRWEAVAVNADFWSQVLQSRMLKPLDFALGAVMAVRRAALEEIGGFTALANHLADDYQLGHRIAARGHRIELCPIVVECWDSPQGWRASWNHQIRWARTIRICQPLPYFFSILSNATLWPLLLLVCAPVWWLSFELPHPIGQPGGTILHLNASALVFVLCLIYRLGIACWLQRRLTAAPVPFAQALMAPVKDLLGVAIWLGAFAGNHVEWRGQRYLVKRDGRLTPA